jgi:histone-lysine N-methyltransferase SETMAR
MTLDSENYDGYARPHTSTRARDTILGLEFPVLQHPPYSPDVAPSDFHLLPKLKGHLKGQRYNCDEELKCAVRKLFQKQNTVFKDGFQNLVQRWRKCNEVRGDLVESVLKCVVV